jgi:acyl carrier protein
MPTQVSSCNADMREHIRDLIVSRLGVNRAQVVIDADLREDLGADSLDVAELMATMGKFSKNGSPLLAYHSSRSLAKVRTVNHLLALVPAIP